MTGFHQWLNEVSTKFDEVEIITSNHLESSKFDGIKLTHTSNFIKLCIKLVFRLLSDRSLIEISAIDDGTVDERHQTRQTLPSSNLNARRATTTA